MLKDFRRRQQVSRRGEAHERWRLYESKAGKVPKELEEMFSGIPHARQVKRMPKVPVLTEGENETLRRALKAIERHGIKRVERAVGLEGDVPPNIVPVVAARPLMELKVKSSKHNPRFIYVDCSDVAVFLDAFKKKTQKLEKKDIERSVNRNADLRIRGECS